MSDGAVSYDELRQSLVLCYPEACQPCYRTDLSTLRLANAVLEGTLTSGEVAEHAAQDADEVRRVCTGAVALEGFGRVRCTGAMNTPVIEL